jgi:hypothetical protein
MELTNEKLAEMQKFLITSFDYYSKYPTSHEYTGISIKSINALLAIENEKRTRAEYKPHTTLQKD